MQRMDRAMRLRGAPGRWWQNRAFRAFAIGFLTAFAFFIPFIIFDQGYFLFYGDFNVQQVPFYQMLHDAIRSGDFLWSWTTDLGANTIGSYTFYNLGSPFFWLTLPFPSEAVPYLMGPLLMLKFACASLGGYVFLKRYVKNPDYAVLGGLLYAFSGFSVYNIFFNHFHEAIIIFPLLLAALDAYMVEKRRGVFLLAVFASCLMNYYFFAGQVVFCLLYFVVRLASGSWRLTARKFGWLAFESVCGVLLTGVLMVPTVLAVMQNSRVNSPIYGWGALLYGDEQRYLHILSCLFFPPDIPARANFTPSSNANWASLGAWLPLFSMTGVFAWCRLRGKSWIKRMTLLLMIMAFIPVLNSAFQLFNSAYYARWFYMLTLLASLCTVAALEREDAEWDVAFRRTALITAAIAVGIGLMPATIDQEKGTVTFGLEKYPERFWTYVVIAFVSLLLLYLILSVRKTNGRRFLRLATVGVVAMSVLYATYFIGLGKTQSYDTHNYIIPYALNGGKDLSLPDDEGQEQNYRIDFYNGMDNMAMFWQMPSIQAFHSIVPGSVMEFYPSVGVERGVGSRPDVTHAGLRGLLSVKYLFDYANDNDSFMEGERAKIPGFSYYATQNGFDVYQNDAYIPFGFTYDRFITRKQFESEIESQRENLLLDVLMVEEEDAERAAEVLEWQQTVEYSYYSDEQILALCEERAREACDSFVRDGSGFTASIDLSKENYVFFSVPWEEGWSASVDGQEADILKVNNGFMAVRVPAGRHEIDFHYFTPGLRFGAVVSLAALLFFAAYLFWLPRRDKKRASLKAGAPAGGTAAQEALDEPGSDRS